MRLRGNNTTEQLKPKNIVQKNGKMCNKSEREELSNINPNWVKSHPNYVNTKMI